MGGLASSAMYLAATLASGPPPVVAVDPAPVIVDAPAAAPTRRAYVIVDLPAASGARPRGWAAAKPEIAPSPPTEATASEPSVASEADVIASHDQRIDLIRARIGVLRKDKAEQAAIAMLDGRLRRAEAARQLAVARVALARCDVPCRPRSSVPVRPTATAAIADRKQPAPSPRPVAASVSSTAGTPVLVAPASVGKAAPPAAQTLDTHVEPLGRARLLLAKARAALTDEPAPQIELAGLWQWEGSERWSLSAGPQRSA